MGLGVRGCEVAVCPEGEGLKVALPGTSHSHELARGRGIHVIMVQW